MTWTRRKALSAGAAFSASPAAAVGTVSAGGPMYGVISEITAVAGRRDELASLLIQGAKNMPGCLSYVVAADAAKPDALWITEVWADAKSHAASLNLPAVRDAVNKGRPLLAGFASRIETTPLGGVGLLQP